MEVIENIDEDGYASRCMFHGDISGRLHRAAGFCCTSMIFSRCFSLEEDCLGKSLEIEMTTRILLHLFLLIISYVSNGMETNYCASFLPFRYSLSLSVETYSRETWLSSYSGNLVWNNEAKLIRRYTMSIITVPGVPVGLRKRTFVTV